MLPLEAPRPATWTLAAGSDGPRTVYVQYADAVGNLGAVASDTVVLDTTTPVVPTPVTPTPVTPAPTTPADTTAPFVMKVSPSKNAQGVSPRTVVRIKASEALARDTTTAKNVVLKLGKKKIKAKVSLKRGNTIVLRPKRTLADGTYRIVVTRVTDLAGNRLDGNKSKPGIQRVTWKFTV